MYLRTQGLGGQTQIVRACLCRQIHPHRTGGGQERRTLGRGERADVGACACQPGSGHDPFQPASFRPWRPLLRGRGETQFTRVLGVYQQYRLQGGQLHHGLTQLRLPQRGHVGGTPVRQGAMEGHHPRRPQVRQLQRARALGHPTQEEHRHRKTGGRSPVHTKGIDTRDRGPGRGSRGHHGGHASTQSRLTHPLIGFLQGPARNTHPGTQVHTPREQSDFSQINVLSGRLHGPVPGDALDAATADPHGGRSDPRRGDHAFGSDQDVELAHRVPSVLVAENTFRGSTRGMVGEGTGTGPRQGTGRQRSLSRQAPSEGMDITFGTGFPASVGTTKALGGLPTSPGSDTV